MMRFTITCHIIVLGIRADRFDINKSKKQTLHINHIFLFIEIKICNVFKLLITVSVLKFGFQLYLFMLYIISIHLLLSVSICLKYTVTKIHKKY